jgi:hypothetical protein
MLSRNELLEPVLEAVEFFGGGATTGQISKYLRVNYAEDGYQFRWAQQELAKRGLLERPLKRGGEWRIL